MKDQLFQKLTQKDVLPPFPEIITRLREMIEDPEVGINEVAKVIQSDPILTGKLIKLANSVYGSGTAFFATDLNRALARLGLKMAMDLAYSLNVPSMFSGLAEQGIDKTSFWRYSLGLGIVSSKLAQHYGAKQEEMSYAYLGGLMRNIGSLLFVLLVEEYQEFLQEMREQVEKQSGSKSKFLAIEAFEKRKFGLTSAELGGEYIRQCWSVDQKVIDFVEGRPKLLRPQVSYVVEIGRYFLAKEGIDDGIFHLKASLPEGYFDRRLGISPFLYKELQSNVKDALQILG